MTSDRAFRSLMALKGASTSRVLNLLAIASRTQKSGTETRNTLFSSPVLDQSIILKHRLRADDAGRFESSRAVATKVIIPIDQTDLRWGGKSFLLGERGYEDALTEAGKYFGRYDLARDQAVLKLIDEIPSLDPFLLREKLRTNGFNPDARYFQISARDQARMTEYTSLELARLTKMAGGTGYGATSRMVTSLLCDEADEELNPLRVALGLKEKEFTEGVFSWRGFIYYKWCLSDFWPRLIDSLRAIKTVQPVGEISFDAKTSLTRIRQQILKGAKEQSARVKESLALYDDAYDTLIQGQGPSAFRNFLLGAPDLFLEVGEKMGSLSHIASFWQFRFPKHSYARVDADELLAILEDFEKSVGHAAQSDHPQAGFEDSHFAALSPTQRRSETRPGLG